MSLEVTEREINLATRDELSSDQFVAILCRSLPYPMDLVRRLRRMMDESDDGFVIIDEVPLNDKDWRELLRFGFGDSFLPAAGDHYGLVLACQNCHAMAAVRLGDDQNPRFVRFKSKEAQILGQRPELRDC